MVDSNTFQIRKAVFEEFLSQRMPVLYDLAERLGFPSPELILTEPQALLQSISEWLSVQDIAEADRTWITSRIGYYVGELLATSYSGAWHVCEASSSRYWSHYVVGQFAAFSNPNAIVDPFEIASDCIAQPRGRTLEKLILEVVTALRDA